VGGVGSPGSAVVVHTTSGLESDTLPAASRPNTDSWYRVLGRRPVSRYGDPGASAIFWPRK
jgi:hypothetical protein